MLMHKNCILSLIANFPWASDSVIVLSYQNLNFIYNISRKGYIHLLSHITICQLNEYLPELGLGTTFVFSSLSVRSMTSKSLLGVVGVDFTVGEALLPTAGFSLDIIGWNISIHFV